MMMKNLLAISALAVAITGCATGTVDHGYAPYKNRYGEDVVWVEHLQFSKRNVATTASAGNVGQGVAVIAGATPIIGDVIGRAIAAGAGGGGGPVPWVQVRVVRGPNGEDARRFFAAVGTQPYQGIYEIKENSWVRYIPMKDGQPTAYVYACAVESDCLPAEQTGTRP